MKTILLSKFDRLVRRALVQMPPPSIERKKGDSFNLMDAAFWLAAQESAAYYSNHMLTCRPFADGAQLLAHAVRLAPSSGLFLEFGVATGSTINFIAGCTDRMIFGFDSFEGLPEDWRSNYEQGTFETQPPNVRPNVRLVTGLFAESLPQFLAEHPEPIAFLHVDCDLYSSTKTIFELAGHRLRPGSVIVFDEYFNFPGWQHGEFRAFHEFVDQRSLAYRHVGFVPAHQQACVVIDQCSDCF
jgi:predicted O-methyltransferase YrrM